MTGEQWREVEDLFAQLSALPEHERAARLSQIADEEVRREVTSLLEHAYAGETVQNAIAGVMPSADDTLPIGPAGPQRFGPWRVLRRLGKGGQGAVFEGIRDDGGFEQRVAIKIIHWVVDNGPARARFRLERQILAALEHPGIARLLDGGQLEDGTPYLVMEFVEGRPLTAATEGWPIRRKLDLFQQVLAAVAFAHRNRIIHRDLKPANILVTQSGVPKLLDFGIAKLLDQDATRTLTGLDALTPQYASPEQVRGAQVTPATDVYSLGVVLYELLTGRRPYQVDGSTQELIRHVVCDSQPPPPGVSPELDSIIMMALRKEPERRYRTVEDFADDIARAIDHAPVRARPDTWTYRTNRFVRRHRGTLLTAASLALALGAIVLSLTGVLHGPKPESPLDLRQLTASTGMDLWPSFSPDGQRVVFASNRAGRFHLYVRPIVSEGAERLLDTGGEELMEPAWSPDGRTIAAVSTHGIFLVPADGGPPRRATESGNRPRWSPDGRTLVFTSGSMKPVTETLNLHPTMLMLSALDGSPARPLTQEGNPPGSVDLASWLADGRRIIFSSATASGVRPWIVDVSTGKLQPIDVALRDARNPVLSADGRRLYFAGSTALPGLWRARLDSSGKTSTPEKLSPSLVRDLALSTDGSRLAMSVQSGVDGIWTVALDNAGLAAGAPRPLIVDRSVRNLTPGFSADGSAILYSSLREGGNYTVFAANPDGSGTHAIRAGSHADPEAQWVGNDLSLGYVLYSEDKQRSYWIAPPSGPPTRVVLKMDLNRVGRVRMSRDKQKVAVNVTTAAGHHIAVEDRPTGEIRDVTPTNRNITYPYWSPDSQWVAAEEQVANKSNLVIFPAGGGEVQTLVDSFEEAWPSDWAADNDRILFAGQRNGVWNVYWVSKSTRKIVQLTHFDSKSAFVRYPCWSPRNNQVVFERDQLTANIYIADLPQH